MAGKTPTPSYTKATAMLMTGRLGEACGFLRTIRHTLPAAQSIAEEAERVLDDYRRMLDYYGQGGMDPQRTELNDRLYDRTWQLCEQLYDVEMPANAPTGDLSASLEALAQAPTDDNWLGTAFDQIADCRHLTRQQREDLQLALLNEALPEYVRGTLMAATMLNMLESFDAELVEGMYVYTFDDQPVQLQVQAWVTLILVATVHKDRIIRLPRLREQYRLMCESNPDLLMTMQTALLLCREAHTAEKRMDALVRTIDEDDTEQVMQEKMKKFYGFITEGLDLTYNAFCEQSKMPFFSRPDARHHWLLPFSLEQPQMKAIFDDRPQGLPWARLLMQSIGQCETDKYANVLCMLPLGHGTLITKIGQKLEETGLDMKDMIPLPIEHVMRNHLHDLYRYCMLHPKGKAMRNNPFDHDLKMGLNPCLEEVMALGDRTTKIGDLMLTKERWLEAAQMYEIYLNTYGWEYPEELQRLTYAHTKLAQQTGNWQMALNLLKKLHKECPNDRWGQRQLADCLHDIGDYAGEEEVLRLARIYDEKDPVVLTRLGRCYNAQRNYKEAIELLYNADLLQEGRRNTQRELAIALLGTQEYERAWHYAQLAYSHSKARSEDFVTGGHVALQQGDTAKALELYQRAGTSEAVYGLHHDRELLRQAGVEQLDIDLMCELLRTIAPQEEKKQ